MTGSIISGRREKWAAARAAQLPLLSYSLLGMGPSSCFQTMVMVLLVRVMDSKTGGSLEPRDSRSFSGRTVKAGSLSGGWLV